MTSKELGNELECIVKYLCEVANKQDKYALEIVDKVKKNLEVLEILKPNLSVEKGSTWEYLEVKHPFFDTQDEIDKIREWLRNEQ